MRFHRLMLVPCTALMIGARHPPAPAGELVLDARAPVIAVELAGVPLRLRVDLDQHDSVQLNPAAAARLPVTWENDLPLEVGRVQLSSRVAPAILKVGGRTLPAQVAESGRDCCQDADGAIGPDMLPYASVRWRRSDAPASTGVHVLPITSDRETGLSGPSGVGTVRVRFALAADQTIGTAAAGAILAQTWGGRWAGTERRVPITLGVSRPARPIGFTRPGSLIGYGFDQLLVRTSDFGGDTKLPPDPLEPGEIVVSHHLSPQREWAAVTLGRDRLERCGDIVFDVLTRSLALHCAFDQP